MTTVEKIPPSSHLGYQNTLMVIKKFYYWSNLKKEIVDFVAKYMEYWQGKVECKHPTCLLQPIQIPKWKWEVISMDLIVGLSRNFTQHDAITVAIEKISRVTHLLVIKSTNSTSEVAQIFLKEIVRLHGVPKKIISNRDANFTSNFWKELAMKLGTIFGFDTTYHP